MESGYDIRYCENPAPGKPDKTCRQVGAHRKEAHLNGTDEIRAEYSRIANRLKEQKFHRTLTVAERNRHKETIQDLREAAIAERITVAELVGAVCQHQLQAVTQTTKRGTVRRSFELCSLDKKIYQSIYLLILPCFVIDPNATRMAEIVTSSIS